MLTGFDPERAGGWSSVVASRRPLSPVTPIRWLRQHTALRASAQLRGAAAYCGVRHRLSCRPYCSRHKKRATVGDSPDEGTNPRWLLEGQDEVAVKTKVQNRSSSVNCLAPKILLLYRRSQGRITSPCFSDVWRSVGAGGAASPSLLSAVLVLSQHQ